MEFRKKDSRGKSVLGHRCRVHANDGKVFVAVDDAGEPWAPLDECRETAGRGDGECFDFNGLAFGEAGEYFGEVADFAGDA